MFGAFKALRSLVHPSIVLLVTLERIMNFTFYDGYISTMEMLIGIRSMLHGLSASVNHLVDYKHNFKKRLVYTLMLLVQ